MSEGVIPKNENERSERETAHHRLDITSSDWSSAAAPDGQPFPNE